MSPLDRFLLQANGAFEAVADTIAWQLSAAWTFASRLVRRSTT